LKVFHKKAPQISQDNNKKITICFGDIYLYDHTAQKFSVFQRQRNCQAWLNLRFICRYFYFCQNFNNTLEFHSVKISSDSQTLPKLSVQKH
jgi:hypothetical protein